MFAVALRACSFMLFLFLLNRTIQEGPEPLDEERRRPRRCRTRCARCSAGSRGRRAEEDVDGLADLWFVLFILIIAGYLMLDGFDLGVGILHPFVARDDDERRVVPQQHRADLGRQRGLARARRRRAVRRLPDRLRRALLRLLPRDHAGPARAHPAHRRDRVPQQARSRRAGEPLGRRLLRRVGRAAVAARDRARQHRHAACPSTRRRRRGRHLVDLLHPFALLVGLDGGRDGHHARGLLPRTSRPRGPSRRGCSALRARPDGRVRRRSRCSPRVAMFIDRTGRSRRRIVDRIWPFIFPGARGGRLHRSLGAAPAGARRTAFARVGGGHRAAGRSRSAPGCTRTC